MLSLPNIQCKKKIMKKNLSTPFLSTLVYLSSSMSQVSAFTCLVQKSTRISTSSLPFIERHGSTTNNFHRHCHHEPETKLHSAVDKIVSSEIPEKMIPGVESIDNLNDSLEDLLSNLRQKDSFRLYSVDMLASCEYIPQELFECYSESCEIYPIDIEEVPQNIMEADTREHDFELDGWARWDMPTEDYYDTTQFPEEYTGYDGSEVWDFIHNRISFKDIADEEEDWKADFNRAVSGLHSMISAQIVKGIEEKIQSGISLEDEQWQNPEDEFMRRLSPQGETPHALDNLYFGYMLLLSAVSQARDRLLQDCDSGKIDDESSEALKEILSYPLLDDPNIGVASTELHDHAVMDANNLWEARMRARDLMRVMNCVQCNKCRLHAKISVLGISTALQVLLGRKGEGMVEKEITKIHRVELAALITTLSKFSTAIRYSTEMSRRLS